MKVKNLLIIIFLLTLVVLSGCAPSTSQPKDYIRIISVTPNSGLIDGKDTNFKVKVEYNLFSKSEGMLNIGFNYLKIGFISFMDAGKYVKRGYGTHEFNVTVKAKDWGNEGDFVVNVYLDKWPFDIDEWFAHDYKILTF